MKRFKRLKDYWVKRLKDYWVQRLKEPCVFAAAEAGPQEAPRGDEREGRKEGGGSAGD